jgi:hypothetical protein
MGAQLAQFGIVSIVSIVAFMVLARKQRLIL